MDNKLFNREIIIHSQSVKAIQYTTRFGEYIDFTNEDNLEFSYSYDILTHKSNKRDHIVIVELSIKEKDDSKVDDNKKIINQIHIIVEGHYELNEAVKEESYESAKHLGSLSLLINFLRTSMYTITSLTKNGGYNLPLLNLNEIHTKKIKRPITKKVSS